MERDLHCVFVASGELHAQQVLAFLDAAGIDAVERGESLRKTHGLTIDSLGAVEICVDAEHLAQARTLLESVEAGAFRLGDDEPEPAE